MNEIQKELRGRTFGYVSAALGLVAGLAWNEAITSFINHIFPLAKDTVLIKFVYAIILTCVVVVLLKYVESLLSDSKQGK